jgi:hypothetical protein
MTGDHLTSRAVVWRVLDSVVNGSWKRTSLTCVALLRRRMKVTSILDSFSHRPTCLCCNKYIVVVPLIFELFHTVLCNMNGTAGAIRWLDTGVITVWLPLWIRVLRTKLIVAELTRNYSPLYGSRSFIAVNSHAQYFGNCAGTAICTAVEVARCNGRWYY